VLRLQDTWLYNEGSQRAIQYSSMRVGEVRYNLQRRCYVLVGSAFASGAMYISEYKDMRLTKPRGPYRLSCGNERLEDCRLALRSQRFKASLKSQGKFANVVQLVEEPDPAQGAKF